MLVIPHLPLPLKFKYFHPVLSNFGIDRKYWIAGFSEKTYIQLKIRPI